MLILFSFGYFNDRLPSKDLVTRFALLSFVNVCRFVCVLPSVLFFWSDVEFECSIF